MNRVGRISVSLVILIVVVSLNWITFKKEGPVLFYRVLLKDPPRPIPDLKLKDKDEKPYGLKTSGGKPLILNFWASWCEPCRLEMPSLNTFSREFIKEGYRVVAASVNDSFLEVKRFFGSTWPFFEVLWDKGGDVAASLGTVQYPETYLIRSDGREVARFIGDVNWNSMNVKDYVRSSIGPEK